MTDIQVLFGWNSFQNCQAASTCALASIEESGVMNWSDSNLIISIFFYIAASGVYDFSVLSSEIQRQAQLLVTIPNLQQSFVADFMNDSLNLYIGTFTVTDPGYYRFDFQGTNSVLNENEGNYPALYSLVLHQVQNPQNFNFVQEQFSSYYGRRGPSVHFSYQLESTENIFQFLNEVTVPENLDTIGTYAMAIGFDYGYFGIQVNSESERRVLFSVWSPQDTNDPSQIQPENAVLLVAKGNDTLAQVFGSEGSGGQSYLVYPWIAGVSYQFKLEGYPSDDGYSVFTAYFKDPTQPNSDYNLIASWKRPKTQSYLNGIYSFLENFYPETGHITRKAYYNNQQAFDKDGNNLNVTQAIFTYDDTAAQSQRLDYDGGVEQGNGFYLQNCGFFNPTGIKIGDTFKLNS
ncbi:nematoblast specific protein (macronuclear) [Tetrahymena thermophila SB210]|uniref:Nematoblast specific protein n=1 Tax=Tetrahymena thermophila (strain SB210) TaxID=312017 RepID=Q22V74_TETTS|nr:nematoblast specific protein [Tetrahymena thermophila SB210]EAR89074.1 nematoblast specific protein [Tetrahymena thermophila SB210]|eukprot:XP_001009319.1 nematoblast specific protein [Tetrahymena thermophila SB210]